jgi:hypothetical protein
MRGGQAAHIHPGRPLASQKGPPKIIEGGKIHWDDQVIFLDIMEAAFCP